MKHSQRRQRAETPSRLTDAGLDWDTVLKLMGVCFKVKSILLIKVPVLINVYMNVEGKAFCVLSSVSGKRPCLDNMSM